MKTYKEYKSELKLLKEERNKLQKEIFSNETKKLSRYIVELSNGDIYLIRTQFGRKYEDSKFFKIEKLELPRFLDEEKEMKNLAEIMAKCN